MPLSTSVSNAGPAAAVDPELLERTVLQTVSTLLPNIVQTVQEHLDNQASKAAATDENDSDTAEHEFSQASDDDFQFLESSIVNDADETGIPNDLVRQQYSAMSADCRQAFRAGWKRGATLSQRYSRNHDLHAVVARQQVRLQELSDQIARERRETARYSRLSELSHEFAFDPADEADTCRDMTDTQFDRHCTATIVKYARRNDVTNVELFMDPTVRSDRSATGALRPNTAQIERYSREAAAIAARKNAAKRGSTTFEVEFDTLCKQHGIVV